MTTEKTSLSTLNSLNVNLRETTINQISDKDFSFGCLSSVVGLLWLILCRFEQIYFNFGVAHSSYVESVAAVTSLPILLM